MNVDDRTSDAGRTVKRSGTEISQDAAAFGAADRDRLLADVLHRSEVRIVFALTERGDRARDERGGRERRNAAKYVVHGVGR